MRKHFETSSQGIIAHGSLIKSGINYTVRYMNHTDVKSSLALQDHVMDTLRAIGKTHYILPKSEDYLNEHLSKGNALVGTIVKSTEGDRLAAHMLVIYPEKQDDISLADDSTLPVRDVKQLSIVSNILVHQDFRGNKLMQEMLDHWLRMAKQDGKSHAIAEVCVDNPFSWSVFLDCGFVIYAAAHDPRDGSDVVYVHKPLDREFIYSTEPGDTTIIRLFDENEELDSTAHKQLNRLLEKGYHVLDYDSRTHFMLLAKCVGTVPLAPEQDAAPHPPDPEP